MMPLANSYVRPEDAHRPEARFPLALCLCANCALVQLAESVAPKDLFSHYLYFSSYSASFLDHARAMAEALCERFELDRQSLVIEPGSNDGYLLQYFLERGARVLGVEPARNLALEAGRRGIPTLSRFFTGDAVAEIRRDFGLADLLVGNNVLAHVPAAADFLDAAARCLAPAGVAVFEFPYLGDLVRANEFDTVYHEHVFYFSLSAVAGLAARAGLELFDAEPQKVHGGSMRIFLRRCAAGEKSPRLEALIRAEVEDGMTSEAALRSFGRRVGALAAELREMLKRLSASGKRVAAYGAPAKGGTLLNFCRIGRELVSFTVDRNPHKQGLLMPGVHIPIRAPQALLDERPDYVLILPWNITAEIVSQQSEYLARGGRFIVPLPGPRVIEGSAARAAPAAG